MASKMLHRAGNPHPGHNFVS